MTRFQKKRRKFNDIWDVIVSFLNNEHPDPMIRLLEDFVNIVIHVDACLRYDKDPFKSRSRGTNSFNGKRNRPLRTAEGDLELNIPKMRRGSYFPEFLSRWDKTSIGFKTIIANAYYNGVSTRRMRLLFSDLGMDGIDKSMVSRVSSMLEERIDHWLRKPLKQAYSCVWLDATYTKILCDSEESSSRHAESLSVMVAVAIDAQGKREILHFKMCDGETKANWKSFLNELQEKGLESSELWVSDNHKGLNNALMEVYTGQPHQRCIIHWNRNLKDMIPKDLYSRYLPLSSKVVMARSIEEFDEYYDSLLMRAVDYKDTRLEDFLRKSRIEITTYHLFPPEYWTKIKCTNIIERLNKELRAREKPINVFSTYTSIKQIYGYILMIQDKAWLEAGQYVIAPQEEKDVLSYMHNYSLNTIIDSKERNIG